MMIPSIDRQLRRLAGIPKKTSRARTAPPPAPAHPLPLPGSIGYATPEVVGAEVETVKVAVPPAATAEPFVEVHVGIAVPVLLGLLVAAVQLSATIPE
jgi:hypothetical protein